MTARVSAAMQAAIKAYKAAKGRKSVRAIAKRCGVSYRGLYYAIKRGE